jgi:hypothetical protein
MSLYSELVAAGIPVSNHYSDLYFQASAQSIEILKRFPLERGNATWFWNQAPPHKGEQRVDVPFAFEPFWEEKLAQAKRREANDNEAAQ